MLAKPFFFANFISENSFVGNISHQQINHNDFRDFSTETPFYASPDTDDIFLYSSSPDIGGLPVYPSSPDIGGLTFCPPPYINNTTLSSILPTTGIKYEGFSGTYLASPPTF